MPKKTDQYDLILKHLRAGEILTGLDALNILKYKNYKGNQIENRYSQWIWRQYASSIWDDIRLGNVLPFKDSKEPDDEKHVHPLQLDVIERVVVLYSNPDEVVLTPFAGVGSEAYGALKLERKAIAIELKPSYYKQMIKNINSIGEYIPKTVELFKEEEELSISERER